MDQFLKCTLFWNNTLHVSDGLSFRNLGVQDCTYSNRYMYSFKLLMMDGKTVRNM